MSQPDRETLEALFNQVVSLAESERAAFLERACGSDLQLREQVEKLLELDRRECLDLPSAIVDWPVVEDPRLPDQIGPYRIVRKIATGGMGTVFEATQEHPRRTVALKVVRTGFAGPGTLRRLEAESHILAQLQHPGVAQVYAAGVHEEGEIRLPYFAMEYIPNALPLTEYVRSHSLTLREKLELFAQVCDAVSHGHDKGIIHRDLKPDNVIVNPDATPVQPKVIDFGVARATDSDIVTTTIATSSGQLIGTLKYMSPEQVDADPSKIDVRSDVYALGLLLYEMLADRMPYDVSGLPLDEAIRMIREDTPTRPSTMNRQLRGDVETIVLKALEKEPERRYESAAALLNDLRRYLDQQPILARRASSLYHLRVFARRNKVVVSAAALIFVMAVAAAVVSTHFAFSATERADEAERQAYRSNLTFASEAVANERWAEAEHLLQDAPARLRGWEWRHLASRLEQSVRAFELEGSRMSHGGISPDGRWLVTKTNDHQAILFDLQAGGRTQHLETPEIVELAYPGHGHSWFHPDGTTFFVRGFTDNETWIRRWEIDEDQAVEVSTVRVPGGRHWHLGDLHPGTGRLAHTSGSHPLGDRSKVPGLIRIDDITSGAELARFDLGDWVFPSPLQFSPTGRWLAASYHSPGDVVRLILIDCSSWTIRWELKLPIEAQGSRIAFNLAETRLALSGQDGVLRLMDISGDRPREITTRKTPSGLTSAVRFVFDDAMIATSSMADQTVRLWSAEDLAPVGVLSGHDEVVTWLTAGVDSDEVVSLDSGGNVRIWEAGSLDASVLRGHESYVYPVAFSQDQSMIVSGGWDGFVNQPGCLRWWDRATGAPIASAGQPGWHVLHAVANPVDDRFYISLRDMSDDAITPRVMLVDMVSGSMKPLYICASDDPVEGLDVDPSGDRLAIVGLSGMVRIVDAENGSVILERRLGAGGWDHGYRAKFSPDGHTLAVSEDGRIELWDAKYEVRAAWDAHDALIWSLSFDASGERLVSTSRDGTARVWDATTGQPIAVIPAHDTESLCVAFSPDGQRLATGGRARAIHIWETERYTLVGKLTGHTDYVYSLAWSDDGETLISGSGDGTVRVWGTEPAPSRSAARRERTQALERIRPLIESARSGADDPRQVRESLMQNTSLSPRERQIGLQLLLRHSLR